MSVAAMRIIVIGEPSVGTSAILERMTSRGLGSRCVETLREAREDIETFQFDIVLASETLSDGRGYDISEAVVRRESTLMVGVALSEGMLWLPVVEKGERVLGQRALNPGALEIEIVTLLSSTALEYAQRRLRQTKLRTGLALRASELRHKKPVAGPK